MSSLSASSQGNIKHVMRTALVGIKPADQVMLKGYLRVLLRLEADLEWVSANHPKVDLFMINDDFRHAENIVKLLHKHAKIPALYISQTKATNGEGKIEEDLLTLPLKQMHGLSYWLFEQVSVLKKQDNNTRRHTSASREIDYQSSTSDHSAQPVLKENNSHQQSNAHEKSQGSFFSSKRFSDHHTGSQQSRSATQQQPIHKDKQQEHRSRQNTQGKLSGDQSSLINLIKLLQQGKLGDYQLLLNHNVIATVEPSKGLVWENTDLPQSLREGQLSEWKIQSINGHPYKKSEAQDLKQWLWNNSWKQSEELLRLVDDNKTYHLRHWIKPTQQQDRRNLLRVMTAMESAPITINNIAEKSETSVEYSKKIVAGLLFSSHLQPDSYDNLAVVTESTSSQKQESQSSPVGSSISLLDDVLSRREAGENPRPQPSSAIPTSAPTSNQSAPAQPAKKPQKEKMGFLSRLRRKLGL